MVALPGMIKFPDQGSNLYPEVDSQSSNPLDCQNVPSGSHVLTYHFIMASADVTGHGLQLLVDYMNL